MKIDVSSIFFLRESIIIARTLDKL
jgi:hypothetical protein